jgi:hypothetical protein
MAKPMVRKKCWGRKEEVKSKICAKVETYRVFKRRLSAEYGLGCKPPDEVRFS